MSWRHLPVKHCNGQGTTRTLPRKDFLVVAAGHVWAGSLSCKLPWPRSGSCTSLVAYIHWQVMSGYKGVATLDQHGQRTLSQRVCKISPACPGRSLASTHGTELWECLITKSWTQDWIRKGLLTYMDCRELRRWLQEHGVPGEKDGQTIRIPLSLCHQKKLSQ